MAKIISSLSKGLHFVAQVILGIIAFLITFDVLGRWILNKPLKGSVDLTEVGLSLIVFLSLAYTHWKKEHITIDFIVEKFPAKIQYFIDGLVNILISILMILLGWNLYGNAMRLANSNTVTGDLSLPVHIFVLIASIGALVFSLTAIVFAMNYFKKVGNHHES